MLHRVIKAALQKNFATRVTGLNEFVALSQIKAMPILKEIYEKRSSEYEEIWIYKHTTSNVH
jgi:hypothetical protein